MITLKIMHSITCDALDGQPWPPPDDTVLWAVVRRADGITVWRSIKISPSGPPPTDNHLGGSNCHSK